MHPGDGKRVVQYTGVFDTNLDDIAVSKTPVYSEFFFPVTGYQKSDRPVVVKKNRGGACVVVKSRKSVTPSSALLKSNQIHDFEVRTSLRTVWNWIVMTFLFSGNFAKIRRDFVSQQQA